MSTDVDLDRPSGPSAREYLYGLAFLAVFGLLGILAGAFALASSTCACTKPAALEIVNQSTSTVGVDWEAAGLFGTPLFGAGGHIDAPACGVTGWPMATGAVAATVRSGDATREVRFTVSSGGAGPAFIRIDAQGQIDDVAASWPPGTDAATTCR